jgi:hypothetical protein
LRVVIADRRIVGAFDDITKAAGRKTSRPRARVGSHTGTTTAAWTKGKAMKLGIKTLLGTVAPLAALLVAGVQATNCSQERTRCLAEPMRDADEARQRVDRLTAPCSPPP